MKTRRMNLRTWKVPVLVLENWDMPADSVFVDVQEVVPNSVTITKDDLLHIWQVATLTDKTYQQFESELFGEQKD